MTTAVHSCVGGLFDIDSGEAERYASFIKDVFFGDLTGTLKNGSEKEIQPSQLVFSFSNIVTDRCGTNDGVDELITKRRGTGPNFFSTCLQHQRTN